MTATITNESSKAISLSLCEWKNEGQDTDYMTLHPTYFTNYPESDARGFLMAIIFDGDTDPTVYYLKPSYTSAQIKDPKEVWSGDQPLWPL